MIKEFKVCYCCHASKPISMFNKNNQQSDGLTGMCKACISVVRKKYDHKYNQSPNAHENAKRYYYSEKGYAVKKAYWLAYVPTDEQREKIRAAGRLHEKEEKYKARRRRYDQSEKGRARKAKRDKEYQKTDKGKFAKHKVEIKRKYQIKTTECTLTKEEWEEIKNKYGYRCVYCKKNIRLEMDHVIPLSKGGSHTASNVVPACRTCNARKSNHLLSDLPMFKDLIS